MLQAAHSAWDTWHCRWCTLTQAVCGAAGRVRCRQCVMLQAVYSIDSAQCCRQSTSTRNAGHRQGRVQVLHSVAEVHEATGGAGHKEWLAHRRVVRGAVGRAQFTAGTA